MCHFFEFASPVFAENICLFPSLLLKSFFSFFAFYGPFGFPDSVYDRCPAAPTYYVDGLGPYLIQQSKSVNIAQTQNHIMFIVYTKDNRIGHENLTLKFSLNYV